jgi:hypothetical protein
MKRCPACQRTYVEEHLAFCLDDGTPLVRAEPGGFDPMATAVMPEPRVTDPNPYPAYGQPPVAGAAAGGTGIKINNRTLGFTGAGLVIAGFFLPVVSIMGFLGFSYFTLIQFSPAMLTGVGILILGLVSLFLVLKNNFKPLIATGALALLILIIDYIRMKTLVASNLPAMTGTGRAAADPEFNASMNQVIGAVIQLSWGAFVIAAGSILLIIAGAKRQSLP